MRKRSTEADQALPKGARTIILDNQERIISDEPPKDWDRQMIRENMVYETGDLIIDQHAGIVYKAGRLLPISPAEYNLMLYLIENVTLFVSRDHLLEIVEDMYHRRLSDNTLSKHIHRCRSKLKQTTDRAYILTKNSSGYKWNMPVYRKYLSR